MTVEREFGMVIAKALQDEDEAKPSQMVSSRR